MVASLPMLHYRSRLRPRRCRECDVDQVG
jgi:hypothetical protein